MVQDPARRQAGSRRARLLAALELLLAVEPSDLRSMLVASVPVIAPILGAATVSGFVHDRQARALLLAVRTGPARSPITPVIPVDDPAAEAFRTGASYLATPGRNEPWASGRGKVRAVIGAPIVVGGERRGLLLATSTRRDRFTDDDRRFLGIAAEWIGSTVHRATLAQSAAEAAFQDAQKFDAGELIAIVAQDLRSHLTPLRIRLERIAERATADGRVHDGDEAMEARVVVDRLGRLVAELVDVARLQEGIFAVDPRTVDLAALMREIGRTLTTRRNEIVVSAPRELIGDEDPERIRQAVESLVAYAVRRSPRGAPVQVELHSQSRTDGRWAVVTVSDQGPAIAPEAMARIFSGSSTGQAAPNLGVHFAGRIAAAHGGRLTGEAFPGGGLQLRLSLPLATPLGGSERLYHAV